MSRLNKDQVKEYKTKLNNLVDNKDIEDEYKNVLKFYLSNFSYLSQPDTNSHDCYDAISIIQNFMILKELKEINRKLDK